MHPKPLTTALTASLLLISPALAVFDATDGALAGLAVADRAAAVAAAEGVIAEAWNRDGDPALLLAGLRDRLVPHQDAIVAPVAATGTD